MSLIESINPVSVEKMGALLLGKNKALFGTWTWGEPKQGKIILQAIKIYEIHSYE